MRRLRCFSAGPSGPRPILPVLALAFLAACGGDPPDPPETPPPGGGGETITGRERIGWTQPATDAVELATFSYAIYVDNNRVLLSGTTCGSTAGAGGFDCSAQLPQAQMTPGAHVLELAAFTGSGASLLESAKSSPISVNVVTVTTSTEAAEASDGATLTTPDGLRFRVAIVARGLEEPADLAFTPEGRLFAAERRGAVRIVDTNRGAVADAGRVRDAGELMAIAVDPDFARSKRLFFVYTARLEGSVAMRLVRATELNGTLGQAALLLEEPVARVNATAAARFGPDRMLFIGLGDAGNMRQARDLSSPLAKILRLTADGATPRDNPGASPVFSPGHRAPRALAWHPDTGALWEIERWGAHDVSAGTDYGWLFPDQAMLSGATFFRDGAGGTAPHGDLFVAALGAQDLLRVRFESGRPVSRAERLLDGRFGRIGAVTQGPDGALYFTTANRDSWGAGQDLLVRLDLAR
jgi:glucose/arabinose dehydrogenase